MKRFTEWLCILLPALAYWLIIALIVSVVCCSCSTRRVTERVEVPVEVPVVHRDTVRLTLTRHDSVYVRDEVRTSGDTVYMERYHFRDRIRRDTVYVARHDTITAPITVHSSVEKTAAPWWHGWLPFALVALVIIAARLLFRKKL